MIFVFAPLQAAGIFLFQTFAIAGLLVIVGGALIISGNAIALGLMAIAFIANCAVFFLRLLYPWPYNLHLLAGAWFVIAITLGIVVAWAVFGGGAHLSSDRWGDPSLPLDCRGICDAVCFCWPVGLRLRSKGSNSRDDLSPWPAHFSISALLSLTSTGYGDIVPVHPFARSLCNLESVIGQLYPATILARLVTLGLRADSA